ncbi:MAG TPA: hypothetical protein QF720_02750 [Nitrospinota bacterium]|nr:hypothetical protein [Nitrospinota bacterium]|tara:strand:+ start:58938 stop:59906 length:969 start_codon:yes stop_codon:yes gene_type:complete
MLKLNWENIITSSYTLTTSVFLVLASTLVSCGGVSISDLNKSSFFPDSGIRVDNASNPHASVNANGVIFLVYEDRRWEGPGQQLMTSSVDGLNFGEGQNTIDTSNDPRRVLMPDGFTWRYYEYNMSAQEMNSRSSTDGVNFTKDPGTRYTPNSEDNGTIGVYDIYSGLNNEVVMLYIGDMGGTNNVRMALSLNNGLDFSFHDDNVLGDKYAGGGGNTYVDPRSILLQDGSRRLFTMTQGQGPVKPPAQAAGIINSFVSTEHKTYKLESGDRLKWSDFTEFSVLSLNDPVVIQLPEGGHRMYVAAMIEELGENKWAIVSATAK